MKQEHEETIDGREFKFMHLDPFGAIRLQSRVVRAIGSNGEAVAGLLSGKPDPATVIRALAEINEDDAIAIINLVATKSWLKPPGGDAWLLMEPKVMTAHLTGDVLTMWKWLGSAVKFQLSDFFAKRPTA
jgi:hypothetical protein